MRRGVQNVEHRMCNAGRRAHELLWGHSRASLGTSNIQHPTSNIQVKKLDGGWGSPTLIGSLNGERRIAGSAGAPATSGSSPSMFLPSLGSTVPPTHAGLSRLCRWMLGVGCWMLDVPSEARHCRRDCPRTPLTSTLLKFFSFADPRRTIAAPAGPCPTPHASAL